MKGEDISKKLICLQDVARGLVETLLMDFVKQWNLDQPDSKGVRLYKFLQYHNNATQLRISKDLMKETQIQKIPLLSSDIHFKNPISIESLDITSLCLVLNQDVAQFPVRSAENRRDGYYKIPCTHSGHISSCCGTECKHHVSDAKKCKKGKCKKTLKKCIEESAPCCDTCKICKKCRIILGLPICPQEKLRNILQYIRKFRNLVAHTTVEALDKLQTNNFQHNRFPNCSDFDSLWRKCVSHITELLDHLLSAGAITQKEYDVTLVEMRLIQRRKSSELDEQYRSVIEREGVKTTKFKLEFGMREIECWNTGICKFLGIGYHFTEKDIDINSSLSTSVEDYVRAYFSTDYDIDSDSLELIRVGETGANEWPKYKFVLQPTSTTEQDFMKDYGDRRSIASKELWKSLQGYLQNLISEKLYVHVEFRLFKWTTGSIVITTAISKKGENWAESERTLLYNLIMKNCTGHLVTKFVFIESVSQKSSGRPNSIMYKFQLRCRDSATEGVRGVIEKLQNVSTDEKFREILGK